MIASIINRLLRPIVKLIKLPSLREGVGVGSLVVFVLFLSACSTTKHIPDDDQLFIGLEKIAYTDYERNTHAEDTQAEVEAALATAPNGALFGSSYHRTPFPYALWIWNATQDAKTKFGRWIGSLFAKPPVLMSQVNPALRAQVAKQVLRTHGYLHGDVSYREVPQKNPKKAKIAYTVKMDSLFRVDTLSYVGFPPAMQQLIDSTLMESTLLSGDAFSVQKLDDERTRLSQLFRNKGYFYYQPNYASFLADTIGTARANEGHPLDPYSVTLRLQLADSLPEQALHPWYVGTTSVRLRRTAREQTDSIMGRRSLKVMFSGKHVPIRPGVILQGLKLRPRQLFSYDAYQESMQKVNATGVFSSIDFQFTPRADSLDLLLDCVFDKPYDFYVETNFINRTIGRMGPEAKIGLTRRNVFRGGEKLDLNLHGAYEWETSSKGSDMNSYQYGIDASIEFPRILFPRFGRRRSRNTSVASQTSTTNTARRRRFRRYYVPPSTTLKVSSDVVRRPSYYKMHIVSGEWSYRWQSSENSRHEFSPLTIKYQFMNSHTQKFDTLISENVYMRTMMSDYFIPEMRYTYIYTSPSNYLNPIRWEASLSESGNITSLAFAAAGRKWNEKEKKLFKNPYSQHIRFETDFTKTWYLSHVSSLVAHVNVGLLFSYGNSETAPFTELFYAGGANSIRAFNVRTIGPGAFPGIPGHKQMSYIIQNGDFKFVANLEYRRRLFGNLHGAIFLDAGNVWAKKDMEISTVNEIGEKVTKTYSDMTFRFPDAFKQLAVGTGIGLRYDLDFLILRLDWGLGLHLPYETSKKGFYNISRFKDSHSLHFAIGYPF